VIAAGAEYHAAQKLLAAASAEITRASRALAAAVTAQVNDRVQQVGPYRALAAGQPRRLRQVRATAHRRHGGARGVRR
jgi:hypothetical protein